MKPSADHERERSRTHQRVRPRSRSISRPTRIISPERKVWARPRNAIAAMHQEAKSSPAGMLMPMLAPERQAHHEQEDGDEETRRRGSRRRDRGRRGRFGSCGPLREIDDEAWPSLGAFAAGARGSSTRLHRHRAQPATMLSVSTEPNTNFAVERSDVIVESHTNQEDEYGFQASHGSASRYGSAVGARSCPNRRPLLRPPRTPRRPPCLQATG